MAYGFTPTPHKDRRKADPLAYLLPSDMLRAEVRPSDVDGKSVTVWRGTAMAAARLSLRGAQWSEDDRVECAGAVVAHLAGTLHAERHGRPLDVLRWIDHAERFPLTARRREDAIPARDASMSRLMGLAANWRRGEERRRDRDQRAEDARRLSESFTPLGGDQEEDGATVERNGWTVRHAEPLHAEPMAKPSNGRPSEVLAYVARMEAIRDRIALGGPRQRAASMLRALGLPAMGASYVGAYAAAVSSGGVSGDELAAALGASRKTAEKRARRALDSIPSAACLPYLDHADMLGVTAEEYRPAHGLSVEGDWREHDREDACTCRPGKDPANGRAVDAAPLECPQHAIRRLTIRKRAQWNGRKSAAWTDGLPEATRKRLAAAAAISRGRSARSAE